MVTDKVRDRLAKLKAHMESARAIGSEKEAQAFADMLQDLLLKYKLSESEVGDVQEKEIPIGERYCSYAGTGIPLRRKRVAWMEFLARIVADAYNCKFVIHMGTNGISFVGTETDSEISCFAFVTIGRLARDLARSEEHTSELQSQ